ncbi:metallophosphoesterase [Umezawaea beigongshangensis]|uniref:metallophosphoesterase n=1 Tax=Umezawaea beigongshangensis TaxID=2780383 RepID=UPI0018F1815F|nr:metallophosphoesterase [Umezawaea beigongshangensis]
MRLARPALIAVTLVLLFGLPWWTLVAAADWPRPVAVAGTVVFACAFLAFPVLMITGHGGRATDRAANVADALLGGIWVLFSWSVLGVVLRLVLLAAGVDDPLRSRAVALAVLAVAVVLVAVGHAEAMRLPRTRAVDVVLPRLGPGLDGLRVVVLADTHFGPIDRTRWSRRVVDAVNALEADVVCHAGDLADGSVERRRGQVDPLGDVRAAEARLYITGNHEYYSDAPGWLAHMASLGWDTLHNRHRVVERGGDRLVLAGVDDPTGTSSGLAGHGTDLTAALAGTDPDVPVLLLAHQPRQVALAAAAGVDLQISGHTHGGQIWPFHLLVRLEQPSVSGLSRHGERTQLYTSRGTGFWGPPLRVFAPSEITVLTLRSGRA